MRLTELAERSTAVRFLVRNRVLAQFSLDLFAWSAAIVFATVSRFDFDLARVDIPGVLTLVAFAAVLQTGIGLACGLYTGRRRYGSFDEVAALALTVVLVGGILFVIDLWGLPRVVPLSVPIAAAITALVLMGGTRYMWRLALERLGRPSARHGAARMLIFGAGEGGAQAVTAMLRDSNSPYVPVALLDDDPLKSRLRISGIPVVGTRFDIQQAAREHQADTLLIAIPSATSELVAAVADAAVEANLTVRILPPVGELLDSVGLADIRPVTEADLLGRREVEIDLEQVAGYLTGKRVLVTGAGGSIGSELCRQIHRFAPSHLIMLDRDESALHAVQLSIDGQGRLDSPDLVLCDIRDRERLETIFETHRPEVVFHAAALKHVPILERHPQEAAKTNVWGTLNVLQAAQAVGVERFVNVSTDKAADPSNVLGYSKHIGERLTAHVATLTPGVFLSVRFGNVLGSRGSVLETIKAQIAAGGPVTVTHPEVTRYFMTVEEAVRLLIQAGAIGADGELLVLDMGRPVRIQAVAERLVAQAGRPIPLVTTGLRPGEKLHESLTGQGESPQIRSHPLIWHVATRTLDPVELKALDGSRSPTVVMRALRNICTLPSMRTATEIAARPIPDQADGG